MGLLLLPSEEGLLHVGELLEGHVLDDGRQLVVIPDHDPSLQTIHAILNRVRGVSENDIACFNKIHCLNRQLFWKLG